MQCVLCGKEGKLVKVEIEGAVVDVCESCASFGKKITQPEYKMVKRTIRLQFSEDKKELVPKYGKLIEAARLKKGMSREDLAKAIFEKESVVRRLELEEMVPDKELASKIEKLLGINLFEDYVEPKNPIGKKKKLELTLGDVVEVR